MDIGCPHGGGGGITATKQQRAEDLILDLGPELQTDLLRYFTSRERRTRPEDLAQEVYLRLLRLKRVHPIRNPRAYLFRVAASVLADLYRRRSARIRTVPWAADTVELVPSPERSALQTAVSRQRLERLDRVLGELPKRCRRALILHRRDGWTYEEIAVELGVSKSMVKKYLQKALFLCRRALIESSGDSDDDV